MFATAKDNLADAQSVRLQEGFAYDTERLRLDFIFRNNEIRSLKIAPEAVLLL